MAPPPGMSCLMPPLPGKCGWAVLVTFALIPTNTRHHASNLYIVSIDSFCVRLFLSTPSGNCAQRPAERRSGRLFGMAAAQDASMAVPAKSGLKFAMVCACNMNRSMAAHKLLAADK